MSLYQVKIYTVELCFPLRPTAENKIRAGDLTKKKKMMHRQNEAEAV